MKKILIVEDQPNIRKLVTMTLEFGEYELFEAEDGGAGMQAMERVRPDLVLLDVMMPGDLDGYQVCQRIKSRPELRGTVVVLLTARGQKEDLDTGRRAGCDAYLVKPFSPLELIDTVDRLLAH
jgi:CheY-like chemotaxis protein